jgi:DNA-binding GntR family transcriptional regulator
MLVSTIPERVAELLRERVLSGFYEPGARIVEADLARELDISRNTLRSALQMLSFEGLLVQNQFKSTHVPLPHSEDVFETYTLRNALEAMACRLAAGRALTFGTAAMDDTIERMGAASRADDRAAMVAADYGFHTAVVELAGHARLREHYGLLHARTRLYLNLTASVDYELPKIEQIHRRLADAIRAGDATLAERLGGSHSTEDGERLCQILRERETTKRETTT